MSKGYKKEYIDKVKTKFNSNSNDLQSSSKGNTNSTGKPQDAAHSKVLSSSRVVKLG